MIRPRLAKALVKQALGQKIPVYVHFFITHRCGLRCLQCTVPFQDSSNEVSLDQVRLIAKNLQDVGAGLVNIGGGEPMLRGDLPEILTIFHEAGFTTRLQTSAYWATEEKVRRIAETGVGGVSVSLDSLIDEVEDAIYQRPGALKKILEGIYLFREALPAKSSLNMLNCVISRKNITEIPSLVRFAEAIGWRISLAPVHENRFGGNSPFSSSHQDLTPHQEERETVDAVFEELLALKRRGAPIANSSSFLRGAKPYLMGGASDFRCHAGTKYFLIRPNGGFSPCNEFLSDETVLREDFVDRFYTGEFQAKMDGVAKSCEGCMYPCWGEMERLFRREVLVERVKTTKWLEVGRVKPMKKEAFWGAVEGAKSSGAASFRPLQN